MQGVSGCSRGCLGCILCQKALKLSRKVDECKPLPHAVNGRQLVHSVRVPLPCRQPGAYTRPLFSSTSARFVYYTRPQFPAWREHDLWAIWGFSSTRKRLRLSCEVDGSCGISYHKRLRLS